jgi:competence protein ComEA
MRSLLIFGLALTAAAQTLPEGPGKAEAEKLCKQCHEIARAISPRLDRGGWEKSMTKMVAFGMKSTDEEYALVLDYLVKHFPAEDVPRINVNTATAIQMESGLSLKRSQAAAVIAWRKENGGFKSFEDLLKVPGLDAAKLEEKKDRIAY